MNILKRLFCEHDYKFLHNIEWKRSLYMCPKCGSFQYRNEIKCDGCNNIRGCITCKDGSEWAHYEEPTASDRGMAEEIIINLKRVEQDYRIDLTRYIEWLRNKVKKGE